VAGDWLVCAHVPLRLPCTPHLTRPCKTRTDTLPPRPTQVDDAVGFCSAWLEGSGNGNAGATTNKKTALRRAAAQVLGFVAEVEGPRFARRMPALAPGLLRVLQHQVGLMPAWPGRGCCFT
jgi:hypothetical protein